MLLDRMFNVTGLSALSKAMSLREKAHQYIAANIANVDTPGYKARHLDFEAELRQALGEEKGYHVRLMRTNPRHLPQERGGIEGVTGRVVKDPVPRRNDGNSVDIDKEMAMLAENQLLHDTYAQGISSTLAMLKYAISEGRR